MADKRDGMSHSIASTGSGHWVHQFTTAFNAAWIIVWYERMRPQPIWQYHVQDSGLSYRWHWMSIEPWAAEQVIWSIIFGIVIFSGLRLLRRPSEPKMVFDIITGLMAVGGFPLLTVYLYPSSVIYDARMTDWRHPHLVLTSLIVEIGFALTCMVFYYIRRWPLGGFQSVALLVIHFGFWAWVTGNWANPILEMHLYRVISLGMWISILFYFGFPVIGLFASIAWGTYVREFRWPSLATA